MLKKKPRAEFQMELEEKDLLTEIKDKTGISASHVLREGFKMWCKKNGFFRPEVFEKKKKEK